MHTPADIRNTWDAWRQRCTVQGAVIGDLYERPIEPHLQPDRIIPLGPDGHISMIQGMGPNIGEPRVFARAARPVGSLVGRGDAEVGAVEAGDETGLAEMLSAQERESPYELLGVAGA
jgi:hypothetical protein